MKIRFKVFKIMLLCCLSDIWFLIMSQGQFSHFMCHLTVLEAGDDGKARLESETSSEAKQVRNFISGPRKKDNFKPGPNKKFSLVSPMLYPNTQLENCVFSCVVSKYSIREFSVFSIPVGLQVTWNSNPIFFSISMFFLYLVYVPKGSLDGFRQE